MDEVNTSLGRKIADLDLSEAEAEALVVAFGGQVEGEVGGFQKSRTENLNIGVGELQEFTISKDLLGGLRQANWFVPDSFSFGIERE